MSTDTPELDDFEQALAARMGAATDTIDAAGVTREGVDDRIAARRAARRRRQGGIVLAAAALVLAAGIAALAIGAGDSPDSTVITEEGTGQTTEAPTTETPPTTSETSTTDVCDDTRGEGEVAPDPILPGAAGSCVGTETTTGPTTDVPAATEPPTTPSTIPATTETPTTASTTTTSAPAALTPGQACTPGSSPDCIDPEGDGSYVYLIGGAECMASPIGGSQCADLDGDGNAGYPDAG